MDELRRLFNDTADDDQGGKFVKKKSCEYENEDKDHEDE
jgi:hypothetical protein